jgi:hypothetical protein
VTTTIIPAWPQRANEDGGADTPSPPADGPKIRNDGWFPDIDPAALRLRYRIRQDVTAERLREAILGGIMLVGIELAGWQAKRLAEGAARLEDVSPRELDGENRLALLYRRAVASEARALLIEGYRDSDLTGKGDRAVADLDPSIGELRRDRIHSVRDIMGKLRTTVELL